MIYINRDLHLIFHIQRKISAYIPKNKGTGVHVAAARCQGRLAPSVYMTRVPMEMMGTVRPSIQPRFFA